MNRKVKDYSGQLDLIELFTYTYRKEKGVLYRLGTGEWLIPKGTKCYAWSNNWLDWQGDDNNKYYKYRKGEIGDYIMDESIVVPSANIACQHITGRSTNAVEFLGLGE